MGIRHLVCITVVVTLSSVVQGQLACLGELKKCSNVVAQGAGIGHSNDAKEKACKIFQSARTCYTDLKMKPGCESIPFDASSLDSSINAVCSNGPSGTCLGELEKCSSVVAQGAAGIGHSNDTTEKACQIFQSARTCYTDLKKKPGCESIPFNASALDSSINAVCSNSPFGTCHGEIRKCSSVILSARSITSKEAVCKIVQSARTCYTDLKTKKPECVESIQLHASTLDRLYLVNGVCSPTSSSASATLASVFGILSLTIATVCLY